MHFIFALCLYAWAVYDSLWNIALIFLLCFSFTFFPIWFLVSFLAHPNSILLNEDPARYKHSFVVANDLLQTFFLFFVLHFYHISFFGRSNSDFCNKPRSQTIKVRWNALFPPHLTFTFNPTPSISSHFHFRLRFSAHFYFFAVLFFTCLFLSFYMFVMSVSLFVCLMLF